MATFILVLIWAGLGLLSGLLALAAGLRPAGGRVSDWRWLLLPGLGAGLLGGWLGLWLTGRLFSAAIALWVAALVMCVPGLYGRIRRRTQEH